MRLALLADFPLHVLPGLERLAPRGHFATWLPQLSEAFSRQTEHEIHWFVVTRELVPGEPIRWRNQTFHCLHVPGRLRLLHGYRRECALIRERVEELNPALLHAWGTEACYALAGAACRRPWLLSMQGILQEYVRRNRLHPFVYLQAVYEWWALRGAREISVESRWGREVMARLAPKARLHVVEYGVQEIFFQTEWQPEAGRPVAVFVGTIDARKGIQDAVAAFADPRLAGAELHVLGDAENVFAKSLRARATPNVRWCGRRSLPETAAALSRAWCLVLPTRADTSPNVVKEARVMGLPVVTTPCGGQSDYIVDGENGYLVAPGALTALADALRRILESVEEARRLGAGRWTEQREFFRPEHTAEKFARVYAQLSPTSPAP